MLTKKIVGLFSKQNLNISSKILKIKPDLVQFNSLYYASGANFGSCGTAKKSLTKFTANQEEIMEPMPVTLAKPTLRNTKIREQYSEQFDRTPHCQGCSKCGDWERDLPLMTIQEAVREANRCLKCNDAPCQQGCSTTIDIKTFIYNIQNKNWYGAAKVILSDNPLGLTCGQLCPISELCARNCNVSHTEHGAIEINRLQELAVRIFKEMGVPQIRDPSLKDLPPSYKKPIALIGGGAASLSCATFLGRMGYENVHIFEKKQHGGGIVTHEIPQNRAPVEESLWEVEMVKQLGVKFHYGKELGKDFTLEDLRQQGFESIFLGIGLQKPNMAQSDKTLAPSVAKAQKANNFADSKTFLNQVLQSVKIEGKPEAAPKLKGHVVVLGIGDTALDCARSAFRLGAERVSVAFRRGFQDMRANDEIFEPGRMEGINFLPYSAPISYKLNEDGTMVTAIEFDKNLPQNTDPNNLIYNKTNQRYELPCDYVVQAFGCQLPDENWVNEIKHPKTNLIDVDYETGRTKKYDWLFVGGDAIGTKNLVDAVNDGKTASWYIHKYIQEKSGYEVPKEPKLPGFHTAIDLVDISTEVAGVKMSNPFGLASAPPTTSYPMIRRAFEVGYDFAVVKTYTLDKDAVVNVSPRIFKPSADSLKLEPSFGNIELISEKTAEYWIKGAHEIKRDFPDKILISSVMVPYKKEDWLEIIRLSETAPFDMYELNLSCPHGMNEKGMGRACGEDPELVKQITQWVTSATKKPVIVKITPNYGEAEVLAKAAMEGGAHAVTLTNTMPGLQDPLPSGEPIVGVGQDQKHHSAGGMTGPILRPFALRKCSEVAQHVPGIQIFGSGGIISGDHAMSFIQYGAKALQICSAIQNLDAATSFYDLKTSLQANIYCLAKKELYDKGWRGQFPPAGFQKLKTKPDTAPVQTGKNLLSLVGTKLNHISPLTNMTRKEYLAPVINEDNCLQCGRCYVACSDSGYQAIQFDGYNTFPKILEEACTGCAICHAVCPVQDAIDMLPRTTVYTIERGTTPGPNFPKEAIIRAEPVPRK